MTDVDRMTDLTDDERHLRAELATTLVPPPTPASLRLAVDAMAAQQLAPQDRSRRSWREALGMGARGFRLAAGAMAVVALAVVGLLVLQANIERDRVAAPPLPTLPAVTQPALPDPSGTSRITSMAGWIDPETAWAITDVTEILWMTIDGGQSWVEMGSVPAGLVADRVAPTFFDRASGYAGFAQHSQEDGYSIGIHRTIDGGRTWLPVEAGTLPGLPGDSATVDAHFTDLAHGVVLAAIVGIDGLPLPLAAGPPCAGWSTDDGGQRWSALEDAPCGLGARWGSPTLGVVFTDRLGGFVALTDDGGRTWTEGRIPGVGDGDRFATAALVPLPDGGARLLVHRSAVGGGGGWTLAAVETHDGGATWREAWAASEDPLLAHVTALTPDHLVGLGQGNTIPGNVSVFDSWDGGQTWTRTTDSLLIDDGGAATWLDRLHGTLGGGWMDCRDRTKDCSASPSTMWLTNDGGRSWHEVPF